jgi:hypothetical protein
MQGLSESETKTTTQRPWSECAMRSQSARATWMRSKLTFFSIASSTACSLGLPQPSPYDPYQYCVIRSPMAHPANAKFLIKIRSRSVHDLKAPVPQPQLLGSWALTDLFDYFPLWATRRSKCVLARNGGVLRCCGAASDLAVAVLLASIADGRHCFPGPLREYSKCLRILCHKQKCVHERGIVSTEWEKSSTSYGG